MDNKDMSNMLNITIHQRNENKKYNEMTHTRMSKIIDKNNKLKIH